MSIINEIRSLFSHSSGSHEREKADPTQDKNDGNLDILLPDPPRQAEPKEPVRIEVSEADKIGHEKFIAYIREVGRIIHGKKVRKE